MSADSFTPSPKAPEKAVTPWRAVFAVYAEPATLRMLLLGFSAGLPLLLVFGTLSFWLREAGINRTTIGYLSWVGLAYAFKWVWAPLVDRMPIPVLTRLLGRRRSWLLASQIVIISALIGISLTDPRLALTPVVWCALAIAFGSATQDIALDAYRIESADTDRQAALAAAYQTGYRIAMIWAGAGALWIAARAEVGGVVGYQQGAWQTAYGVMAASMLLGVATVLLSPEPAMRAIAPARNAAEWLKSAVLQRPHRARPLSYSTLCPKRRHQRSKSLIRGGEKLRRVIDLHGDCALGRLARHLEQAGRDAPSYFTLPRIKNSW
jgi:PAT family beta-lactamase induction signal transducer AmpG